MRCSSCHLRIITLLLSTLVLITAAWEGGTSADDTSNYILTQDSFNKMMGVLSDLQAKNLPLSISGGQLDAEISRLQKQPKVEGIIKKRGLSLREFVLTYKAASQIRETEKNRENWTRILTDPNTTPQAKLEATQKLGDSLKNNLFTPEQMELVRRRMPDLDNLFPKPK
jgi:hypothetical protein